MLFSEYCLSKQRSRSPYVVSQRRSVSVRKSLPPYSYCPGSRPLGQGLTSKAFLGLCESTGQPVCIKVVELGVTPEQLLRSQIAIMKELKHPNVVELKQVFMTENNCYIVMDYCDGGDMARLLRGRGRLPESQALGLIRAILHGFKYLVARGIVHRDIKPANCFLKGNLVKIADFGFAMKVGDPILSKMNVGSPVYMPPEALQNCQYSFKSDIFSLGILYYELLHGYTPWPCHSEPELLAKMLSQPIKINSSVSEASKDFIKKCLKINRGERMNEIDIFMHEIYTGEPSSSLSAGGLDSTKETKEAIDEYQLKPVRPKREAKQKPRESISSSNGKICIDVRKNSIIESGARKQQHNLEPMLRRLSRQIRRQRARIQSERLSTPSPPAPRTLRLLPVSSRIPPSRNIQTIDRIFKINSREERQYRRLHSQYSGGS